MAPSAKGRVSSTKLRVEAARARLESTRSRSRSVDATLAALERDRERAGRLLARALAYQLFLWLLPFTLVLVAGLGFLSSAHQSAPKDLAAHLGIVGLASQSISRAAADAEHARFVVLVVGVPVLYLASVGTITAFRTVSALAWGVPAGPVPRKPLAVLVFLGLPLAGGVVILVSTAIQHSSEGPGLIATALAVVAYIAISFVVLRALPRPDVPWTALAPGALALGLGMGAIHFIVVYFISNRVSRSSQTYGALGAAAALLLALYFMGRLFVAAVMLNSALWERAGAPGA
jgi:uncharacterized BrkB/YihY/UPF0761 family membrane protein